jgi:hypothetical protein
MVAVLASVGHLLLPFIFPGPGSGNSHNRQSHEPPGGVVGFTLTKQDPTDTPDSL